MAPIPQQQDFMVFPIHKNNMSMHPLVSACGTATYNTAKFITKILQNYCGKTSSFVKASTDFIKKIKHLSINPEEETLVSFDVTVLFTSIPIPVALQPVALQTLVSFDVTVLFTSIPVPVALQVINSKISTCTNFTYVCKIPKEKFIKLLEFTITNCIFCFNKKFYKQLQGVAMDSPVSPVIANIYMEYSDLAIPSSPTLIKWWFRYIDDVHSATRGRSSQQISRAPQFHRSTHEILHRTLRMNGLPFLDTMTKPLLTPLNPQSYRKPTHTDRYLDYNSNPPISAKLSVIHTLIHRAKQVCSTPEFHAKEIDHLNKVL